MVALLACAGESAIHERCSVDPHPYPPTRHHYRSHTACRYRHLPTSGYQLYLWFNPSPLVLSLEIVRPQKFKVDITEFFAPKVSATFQLVMQVPKQ